MPLLNKTQRYVCDRRRECLSRKTNNTPGCFGRAHAQHDSLANAHLWLSACQCVVDDDRISVSRREVSAFDNIQLQKLSVRRQRDDAETINVRAATVQHRSLHWREDPGRSARCALLDK